MRTILLEDFTSLAIIVWVCLLVTTLADLFARTDLSAWKKIMWAVAVLAVPMGALAYMALKGRAITDRNAARLLQSDGDPHSGTPSSRSDELADVDHLVPMIQRAIEISAFLDMEDPAREMVQELDRTGMGNEAANGEHVYAQELNRNSPHPGDTKRFPAMAA